MRGLSSLPLDDDIIDRILMFLPDYPTLRATILSSKSFFNVFKAHPHSIIRAVSYNLVGPALPQALRVIRYNPPEPDAQTDPLKTPPPIPWTESHPVSPITHKECRQLAQNAQSINSLEDMFSFRHKIRSSTKSVLDSMESWRFRRAMYRLELLAKVSPASLDDSSDNESDDGDEELVQEKVRKARSERKKLLEEYNSYELYELNSAARFLVEVAEWASVAQYGASEEICSHEDLVIACGPAETLKALTRRRIEDIIQYIGDEGETPPVLEDYLTYPLNKIWEGRKSKPPPDDSTHWSSILDSTPSDKDTCHSCNKILGLDLWNETNWEWLRGRFPSTSIQAIPRLAKGNISQNTLYAGALSNLIAISPAFTYEKFFNELHQIRTQAYHAWDKQDWLCEECVTTIIKDHLHFWLLERKKEAGEQIPEDCWYGYNCRTQTHKIYHATRLNHLCEPAR